MPQYHALSENCIWASVPIERGVVGDISIYALLAKVPFTESGLKVFKVYLDVTVPVPSSHLVDGS